MVLGKIIRFPFRVIFRIIKAVYSLFFFTYLLVTSRPYVLGLFSGFTAWTCLLFYSAVFDPVNLVEISLGNFNILLDLLLLFFGASTIYSIPAGEINFGPGVADGFETMTLVLFNFNYLLILAARLGLIPTEPLTFLAANLYLPYHSLYIIPAFAFMRIMSVLVE